MIFPRDYWTAPVEMLVKDFFAPEPSVMTQLEGTSLNITDQFRLQDAIMQRDTLQTLTEKLNTDAEKDAMPLGKKLGVYVDGKLRLQTRDAEAAYEYAGRRMREKHNVWIAPVGSFVEV